MTGGWSNLKEEPVWISVCVPRTVILCLLRPGLKGMMLEAEETRLGEGMVIKKQMS